MKTPNTQLSTLNLEHGPWLPVNICSHPDGLLVRVQRGGVTLQAFVPRGHRDPLAEALRERDRFYRLAGEQALRGPRVRAHSNTGIAGISESQTWRRGKPYSNFEVSYQDNGQTRCRRIYYGAGRDRMSALREAVRLRRERAGALITDAQVQGACV